MLIVLKLPKFLLYNEQYISSDMKILIGLNLACSVRDKRRDKKTCLQGFRPGPTPTGCTATEDG